MVTLMGNEHSAAFQSAAYTYPEVGATGQHVLPPGYDHLTASRTLRHRSFDAASDLLMTWQLQERSGLQVEASSPRAERGTVVLMRVGIGPTAVRIPCRVVYTVDESDRIGFAYGTLPGHPEAGEELFVVDRSGVDDVVVSISAFSRPATTLARAGGPVTRWMQRRMTERYLHALDAVS